MNLQPGNYFTVVRQIANHTDAATYYVRAVIRQAYTDAIITSLNLTDKGSQRFKKDWQVPADSSGQGFYISIVTSVYEDSGYTTKSANYGDEETTYLVQDRLTQMHGGGGIDAFTVRRIVAEELDKRGPDYSAITGAIGAVQREVNRIPKEFNDRTDEVLAAVKDSKPDPTNLAPVMEKIDKAVAAVERFVEEKEITPETDLTPVLDKIQAFVEENGTDFKELKDNLTADSERLVGQVGQTIQDALHTTKFSSTFTTQAEPKAVKQESAPAFDLNQLAS